MCSGLSAVLLRSCGEGDKTASLEKYYFYNISMPLVSLVSDFDNNQLPDRKARKSEDSEPVLFTNWRTSSWSCDNIVHCGQRATELEPKKRHDGYTD